MKNSFLLLGLLLIIGCGQTIGPADAEAVFTAGLDAWEKKAAAEECPDTQALRGCLDDAARTRGATSWKDFARKARASMGDKAWDQTWERLAVLQEERLRAMVKSR